MSPVRIHTRLFIFPLIRQRRSFPSWHFTRTRSKPNSRVATPSTSFATGRTKSLISSSLRTFFLPTVLPQIRVVLVREGGMLLKNMLRKESRDLIKASFEYVRDCQGIKNLPQTCESLTICPKLSLFGRVVCPKFLKPLLDGSALPLLPS